MLKFMTRPLALVKLNRNLFGSKVFKLPSIAESVEEVTIVNMLKKEGEFVN